MKTVTMINDLLELATITKQAELLGIELHFLTR